METDNIIRIKVRDFLEGNFRILSRLFYDDYNKKEDAHTFLYMINSNEFEVLLNSRVMSLLLGGGYQIIYNNLIPTIQGRGIDLVKKICDTNISLKMHNMLYTEKNIINDYKPFLEGTVQARI